MSFVQSSHFTGIKVLKTSSSKSIVQTKKINEVKIAPTVKPRF